MAARPIWRGHLRLALVSCPVSLFAARHDRENLHFHYIVPDTGHRVRMVTQDAETHEEVARGHLARGFEFKKDHYVIIDDADFEAARIESSDTMTIDKFVPVGSIDPVYYDASYYVVPDGDVGADVYAVLRRAIEESGTVALSRVVIARRERAIALMPMGDGLIVHTLQEERDINSPAALFEAAPKTRVDPEMVKLARLLIDRQTGRYDPADMVDRYEQRLRAVIDAKVRGIEPEAAEVEAAPSNVIDLMAALKQSLGDRTSPTGMVPTRAAATKAALAKTKGRAVKAAATPREAEPAAKKPAPRARRSA